jgi:tetrahydromethanopterin S-methyltransferase subunit G
MVSAKRTTTFSSSDTSSIESRLQALEEKSHTPCGNGGSGLEERLSELEKRIDDFVVRLSKKISF